MGRIFDSLQRQYDSMTPSEDVTVTVRCDYCRKWWDAEREDELCPHCAKCDVCGWELKEHGMGTCDDCARHACLDCDETLAPIVAIRCERCVAEDM